MKLTRWQWGIVALLVVYAAVSGPVTSYADLLGQIIGAGVFSTLIVSTCAFSSRKIKEKIGWRDAETQSADVA